MLREYQANKNQTILGLKYGILVLNILAQAYKNQTILGLKLYPYCLVKEHRTNKNQTILGLKYYCCNNFVQKFLRIKIRLYQD